MTKRQWSLVIVLLLVNYLIFSQLFQRIMDVSPADVQVATATPVPTFTPSPVVTAPLVAENPIIPVPPAEPTPTNTPVLMTDEQRQAMEATQTAQAAPSVEPTATPSPTPVDTRPQVTASDSTVNLRAGPGTNYDRVGALPQGASLEIVGRNADSSWWQVSTVNGLAWIAASVTTAKNTAASIPVVQAPPPPVTPTPSSPPTATPVPLPQYQYSIFNVFWKPNKAMTQIRGHIQDAANNDVNGVYVRVRSGTYCVVSYPSGPGEGNYPPGNYDIYLGEGERTNTWQVDIVPHTADPNSSACHNMTPLSETKEVQTGVDESVAFVEWIKNY